MTPKKGLGLWFTSLLSSNPLRALLRYPPIKRRTCDNVESVPITSPSKSFGPRIIHKANGRPAAAFESEPLNQDSTITMRESLPLTRMSMSVLNQEHPNGRDLRLWLLSAATHHGVTYYRIAGRFTSSGQTWEVSHRYSEFLELRDKLVKFLSSTTDKCPGCRNYLHSIQRFAFPKKHLFASRAPPVVNYRVKALRSFINLLASWAFSKTPKCPTCGGYAFEVVRTFVLEGDGLSADVDMNTIRQSMAVQAFAEQNLSSSRVQKLSRTNSWMKSSSSVNPDMTQSMYVPHSSGDPPSSNSTLSGAPPPPCRGQRSAKDRPSFTRSASQQPRTTSQVSKERRRQQDVDPYDAFNDYLPEKQSKVKKLSQQNMEQKTQNGKFSSRPLQASIDEKKMRQIREQEEANAFQQKLVKYRSEPRLATQSMLKENELLDDTSARKRNETASRNDGSSMVSDALSLEDLQCDGPAGNRRLATSAVGSVYSGDDELELTGVAMASSPPASKKGSTNDLWQQWELARVA